MQNARKKIEKERQQPWMSQIVTTVYKALVKPLLDQILRVTETLKISFWCP